MRAGDLRQQVTFEQKVKTPDEMGGFDSTWQTQATVWAAIWPLKSDERTAGAQQVGAITHRVRVRFRRNLHRDMRIRYGNKYFSISAEPIDMGMRHEFMEFLCREVSA